MNLAVETPAFEKSTAEPNFDIPTPNALKEAEQLPADISTNNGASASLRGDGEDCFNPISPVFVTKNLDDAPSFTVIT